MTRQKAPSVVIQLVPLNLSNPLNTKLQDRKRRTAWFAFFVWDEVTETFMVLNLS
ncbi:hypothetical protein [Vibrio owensii]|uniref:hypothetical protein n=1 Tax=Vibrio owensii TaxID=696485 RepID=UPI0038CF29B8